MGNGASAVPAGGAGGVEGAEEARQAQERALRERFSTVAPVLMSWTARDVEVTLERVKSLSALRTRAVLPPHWEGSEPVLLGRAAFFSAFEEGRLPPDGVAVGGLRTGGGGSVSGASIASAPSPVALGKSVFACFAAATDALSSPISLRPWSSLLSGKVGGAGEEWFAAGGGGGGGGGGGEALGGGGGGSAEE